VNTLKEQFDEFLRENRHESAPLSSIYRLAQVRRRRSRTRLWGSTSAAMLVLTAILAFTLTASSTRQPSANHPRPGNILASTVNSASVFEGIPLALQPSDAGTWLFTSQGVWMGDTLGTTWLQLARPEDLSSTTSIASGTASDALHAWVVIQPTSGARALVIDRTSDGGETWQGSSVPISEMPPSYEFAPGVPAIAFSDNMHGFLVVPEPFAPGATSTLFGTSDGGATWKKVSSTVPVNDIAVTSGPTLWGNPLGQGGPVSGLLRSTDGGLTWSPVLLPGIADHASVVAEPPSSVAGSLVVPIAYELPNEMYYTLVVFRSSDDGQSWSTTTPVVDSNLAAPPDVSGGPSVFHSASFVSATNWVITWPNVVFESWDGGSTWTEISSYPPSTDYAIVGVLFRSQQQGIAVLTNSQCVSESPEGPFTCTDISKIVATSDGGSSWVPAATGSSSYATSP
jgi:photosystem II stability/assembly factor-like uncharacterized protein